MSLAQRSATRCTCIAGSLEAWEKPNPGKDGATTSNESAGSAPWLPGSASNGMTLVISKKVLGQPWVMTSGIGLGPLPRSKMK